MGTPLANLSLRALLLVVALSCRGAGDRVFEVPGNAPSFIGLVELPAGAAAVSDVGLVRCVSATGEVLWRTEVCRPVRQRPAVIGGSLWIVCENGEWAALDVKTGRERWREPGRRAALAPLASDGLRGFISATDGTLEAIDETGTMQWAAAGFGRLWAGADIVATAGEKGVLVYQAANGARMWGDDKPALGLAGDERSVLAARVSGDLVAYDPTHGDVRWSVTLGAFAPDTLSVDGDSVWVGLSRGDVVELKVSDGTERSRVTLSAALAAPVRWHLAPLQGREGCVAVLGTAQTICVDHQLRGSPVVRDGVVLLAPRDGRVLGYRLRSAGAP